MIARFRWVPPPRARFRWVTRQGPVEALAAEPPPRVAAVFGPGGRTAYQVAVDQGFQGTVQQWLDSLKGQAGVPPIIRGGSF